MPTVTKSIGTTGRDYSTMTSWEADLDNAGLYASGDTAVGECYNDSAFDESVTIDGGGTVGLTKTLLTVAAGQRHNGAAGTGARIVASTGRFIVLAAASFERELAWLSFDGGDFDNAATYVINLAASVGDYGQIARNLLVHRITDSDGTAGVIMAAGFGLSGHGNRIQNCIVYDFHQSAGYGQIDGVQFNQGEGYNLTVHNGTASGSGGAKGITGGSTVQNCLVTDMKTSCFSFSTSYNASSDLTATGTGSLTSIVEANTYVSTVAGSEDLHLKSGTSCIDAGTDLVTTPANVNIDIDGRDRDATGDVWDIGADEFVAAGGGSTLIGLAFGGGRTMGGRIVHARS